jgi:hypothetical protein
VALLNKSKLGVTTNSLAHVMKVDITIPDFSGISKRSIALPRNILTKAVELG